MGRSTWFLYNISVGVDKHRAVRSNEVLVQIPRTNHQKSLDHSRCFSLVTGAFLLSLSLEQCCIRLTSLVHSTSEYFNPHLLPHCCFSRSSQSDAQNQDSATVRGGQRNIFKGEESFKDHNICSRNSTVFLCVDDIAKKCFRICFNFACYFIDNRGCFHINRSLQFSL